MTPDAISQLAEAMGGHSALARALNVSQAAVTRWIRGQREPNPEAAAAMRTLIERQTMRIPADWQIDDPGTWSLTSTVDAFLGIHAATGMPIRQYRTITHSARDLDSSGDIQPTLDHAAWWVDVLGPIHTLACRIADVDDRTETAWRQALGIGPDDDIREAEGESDDLEHEAIHARRILAALERITNG